MARGCEGLVLALGEVERLVGWRKGWKEGPDKCGYGPEGRRIRRSVLGGEYRSRGGGLGELVLMEPEAALLGQRHLWWPDWCLASRSRWIDRGLLKVLVRVEHEMLLLCFLPEEERCDSGSAGTLLLLRGLSGVWLLQTHLRTP